MTTSERDSLIRLPMRNLKMRLELIDCVLMDGIREMAGETAIKEVIRQKDVIHQAIKDKLVSNAKRKKPEGIVIGMKPINLRMFKGGI